MLVLALLSIGAGSVLLTAWLIWLDDRSPDL